MKKISSKILARWLRKSKSCFHMNSLSGNEQWKRSIDLAIDVYKILDKKNFNRIRG